MHDPERIEDAIDETTRAIIPVHLYGHPCDMDPIMSIAKRHGLYVIEDVAEAPGAEYKGKKVGSFGDISCFSFFGNKIITTGEGGMCLTNSNELDYKIRTLKNQGIAPDSNNHYWHETIGFNYRMTNVAAALGVAQLERIDSLIGKRRQAAASYNNLLGNVKGIVTAPEMKWAKSVFWVYSVLTEKRDKMIDALAHAGIETRPFFYPINELPPYKTGSRFEISSYLSKKGINLPSGSRLTAKQIMEVCNKMKSAL